MDLLRQPTRILSPGLLTRHCDPLKLRIKQANLEENGLLLKLDVVTNLRLKVGFFFTPYNICLALMQQINTFLLSIHISLLLLLLFRLTSKLDQCKAS